MKFIKVLVSYSIDTVKCKCQYNLKIISPSVIEAKYKYEQFFKILLYHIHVILRSISVVYFQNK